MPEQIEQRDAPHEPLLVGTILLLVQFDVCEEICVDELAKRIGARTVASYGPQSSSFGYVRYERPPVVEPIDRVAFPNEALLGGELKYYDYGVVSLLLQRPFTGRWDDLIKLASHWIWDVDLATHAERIVREKLTRAIPCMIKPYTRYLSEDYLIFHIREISAVRNASQVTSQYGGRIAQVVRGETGELAESEIGEVMRSQISYYNTDLAVIGWNAAFLYDTAAGGESAVALLEYANSQLLEFRHYDELLTRELEEVYKQLEEKAGKFGRWRLAKSAKRLQATLLEVTELTEHADNAIKFLSDMFLARLYKLAAARIGVPDYKDLVTGKIHVAEELYRFMVDQFNQSRAFFLELIVVIILIVELIFLFRGKPF
jgi:hypothetical protein